MANIHIIGVNSGSKSYTVHVVLAETANPEDPGDVTVLGEAFVELPEAAEMTDVWDKIIDAAHGIMKKHKDSADKRRDIEELDFPPIN
ncbi:hypothetical protein ES703_80367 [subsurface metagenome]